MIGAPGASTSSGVIRVAAALIVDGRGRQLLVRKRGTTLLMQAGGKIEPGEEPVEALVRELDEELGLLIDPTLAESLGQFRARAAHEPGWDVVADAFRVLTDDEPRPAAEIAEIEWVELAAPAQGRYAPLTMDLLALERARPR